MKITKLWGVRDPSNVSEMSDILFPISDAAQLARVIHGTGVSTWEKENTTLYTEESEAKRDAEARMKKKGKHASMAQRVAARVREA